MVPDTRSTLRRLLTPVRKDKGLHDAFRVATFTYMRVEVWDEQKLETAEIPKPTVRQVSVFAEHTQVDSSGGSS